jgi:hypothetical protein
VRERSRFKTWRRLTRRRLKRALWSLARVERMKWLKWGRVVKMRFLRKCLRKREREEKKSSKKRWTSNERVSGTEKGIDNKLVFLYKTEERELSHSILQSRDAT